jgi:hypothetical protein
MLQIFVRSVIRSWCFNAPIAGACCQAASNRANAVRCAGGPRVVLEWRRAVREEVT